MRERETKVGSFSMRSRLIRLASREMADSRVDPEWHLLLLPHPLELL